jgi:hypothetical protein
MANLAENIPDLQEEGFQISLNWKENPSAKKLLNAIVSILAEEYIETAKQNPDIFTK